MIENTLDRLTFRIAIRNKIENKAITAEPGPITAEDAIAAMEVVLSPKGVSDERGFSELKNHLFLGVRTS